MADTNLPTRTITGVALEQLSRAARDIIDFGQNTFVWLFDGDMGAGKTTLIKAIGQQWQVEDTVSSPTYTLVNEYRTLDGDQLYHFDFYRIEDEEEAIDLGIEEYFESQRYCLVEWPSKIRNLLPETYIRIEIQVNKDQTRTIYLSRHEQAG